MKQKSPTVISTDSAAPAHFINEEIRYAVEELENLVLFSDEQINQYGELVLFSATNTYDRKIEFYWKGKLAITFTGVTNFQLGTLSLEAQHHYDENRVATFGKETS